jgi:hypothetical protein
MPSIYGGHGRAVHAGASWKAPGSLLVFAFFLAAAPVYWWGLQVAGRHQPADKFAATSSIRLPANLAVGAEGEQSKWPARPSPASIRQYILSTAGEHGSAGLAVSVTAGINAKDLEIALTATDTAADNAVRTVNRLAQSYTEVCRAEWRSRTEHAYAAARDAANRSEREVRDAQGRLEAFYHQRFREPRPTPPQSPPAQKGEPADDPQWAELNRQLGELVQRRDGLLASRYPTHPEIRDLEFRIGGLREQLAATPRRALEQEPAGGMAGPQVPDPAAARTAQDADTVQRLKEAVERASQASQQAARGERQAWQTRLELPQIDLALAEVPPPPPPPAPNVGLLLTALAAGLTTIAGVGMVWAGAAVQPVLVTAAEVGNVLRVPVVGTLRETDSTDGPKTSPRRQRLARAALVLTGVLLIAGFAGTLVVYME